MERRQLRDQGRASLAQLDLKLALTKGILLNRAEIILGVLGAPPLTLEGGASLGHML